MIAPQELTAAELDSIRHLIPDPEPPLGEPVGTPDAPAPDGPLRVCETLLDGNERRYVLECFEHEPHLVGRTVRRPVRRGVRRGGRLPLRRRLLERHGSAPSGARRGRRRPRRRGPDADVHHDRDAERRDVARRDTGVRRRRARHLEPRRRPAREQDHVAHARHRARPHLRPSLPHGPDRRSARRYRLVVVEDAAEAHGARYDRRPVGSLGDAAAFSFYGNKIVTTGEGGMVTTNDAAIAARARELRALCFSTERHFWHRSVGFNYRMTNLQAAVGLAQTERLADLVERRRHNRERYAAALEDIPGLGLPVERPGVRSVFWMFALTIDAAAFGCNRDELRRRLARQGIETRTFFVPMHIQPAYFRAHRGESYPTAERLGTTGLYLRRARDCRTPTSPTWRASSAARGSELAARIRRRQGPARRAGRRALVGTSVPTRTPPCGPAIGRTSSASARRRVRARPTSAWCIGCARRSARWPADDPGSCARAVTRPRGAGGGRARAGPGARVRCVGRRSRAGLRAAPPPGTPSGRGDRLVHDLSDGEGIADPRATRRRAGRRGVALSPGGGVGSRRRPPLGTPRVPPRGAGAGQLRG